MTGYIVSEEPRRRSGHLRLYSDVPVRGIWLRIRDRSCRGWVVDEFLCERATHKY